MTGRPGRGGGDCPRRLEGALRRARPRARRTGPPARCSRCSAPCLLRPSPHGTAPPLAQVLEGGTRRQPLCLGRAGSGVCSWGAGRGLGPRRGTELWARGDLSWGREFGRGSGTGERGSGTESGERGGGRGRARPGSGTWSGDGGAGTRLGRADAAAERAVCVRGPLRRGALDGGRGPERHCRGGARVDFALQDGSRDSGAESRVGASVGRLRTLLPLFASGLSGASLFPFPCAGREVGGPLALPS